MSEFSRRRIGRTGLEVTELGSRLRDAGRQPDRVARADGRGDRRGRLGRRRALCRYRAVLRRRPGRARGRRRDARPAARRMGAVDQGRPPAAPEPDRRASPTAATIRCRSTRSTTIPMTGSCARSRTACSGSGWRGSTSFTCTISAPTSTAPEAHPGLMRTLRESGYRALEDLRGGGAVRGDRDRRQRARGVARSDGMGPVGRISAGRPLHAAGAGAARRSAAADASPPAPRSWSAGRSIPASSPGATPGTTTRRRPRSSRGSRPSPRSATRTGAAAGRRIAVPAGPSGGCGDHPGAAQRRRIPRQSRPAAPSDPGCAVGRSAAGRAAPSRRAGAGEADRSAPTASRTS